MSLTSSLFTKHKKILLIVVINLCCFLTFSQQRKPNFCFPEVNYLGKKTDSNLKDYLVYKVCNSYKKRIIGVIVAYNSFTTAKSISGNSLAYKEICRIKTSVDFYTEKVVKVYLPYSFEGYDLDNIIISKFIFEDGTSVKASSL